MPKLYDEVFTEFNLDIAWPSLKVPRGKAVSAEIELGFGIVNRNCWSALERFDSQGLDGSILDVKLRSELVVFDGANIDR
jgi:hypothetical protein